MDSAEVNQNQNNKTKYAENKRKRDLEKEIGRAGERENGGGGENRAWDKEYYIKMMNFCCHSRATMIVFIKEWNKFWRRSLLYK